MSLDQETAERELDKVKTESDILQNDLNKKTERIKLLEKQNDRLLKEVRFLTEVKGNNERVHDLKSQNERLRGEVNARNSSKIQMVQNVNQTIEKLREYIGKYQELSGGRIQ